MKSPETVARSSKRSTTSNRQELNTAGEKSWNESLLALIMGVAELLIVAELEMISFLK